jgi:hypothetical protein
MHVVDLVIVTIFNFQTTQVHFVQDWKIPVKFNFKVFSIFRKENMLNFVLKLPSTWVSGSYKRLTVRDYHSIMYRVSGSYKRLTVKSKFIIRSYVIGKMFFIMFFSETAKKLKANLAGIFIR